MFDVCLNVKRVKILNAVEFGALATAVIDQYETKNECDLPYRKAETTCRTASSIYLVMY